MEQDRKRIPGSVVNRLTRYFTHVQGLCQSGAEWVSSAELAEALGLTSSTVRQDLSHIDFRGVSKRGYNACGLEKMLARTLGADTLWRMVVVGAGNLGTALTLHEEFSRRGFKICGIFDADETKVGRKVGRLTVRGMRDLPRMVARQRVDIGLIAVPAASAQKVADLLILSGVRGLLNLALTHVVSPRRVPVVDARVVASLLELAHIIKSSQGKETSPC